MFQAEGICNIHNKVKRDDKPESVFQRKGSNKGNAEQHHK